MFVFYSLNERSQSNDNCEKYRDSYKGGYFFFCIFIYLCEAGFSTFVAIKSRYPSTLGVRANLRAVCCVQNNPKLKWTLWSLPLSLALFNFKNVLFWVASNFDAEIWFARKKSLKSPDLLFKLTWSEYALDALLKEELIVLWRNDTTNNHTNIPAKEKK